MRDETKSIRKGSSQTLSCEDVLILWCNSVAQSVGNKRG